MRKLLIANNSNGILHVDIEPWADFERLSPRERVTFEYEDTEQPAELEGRS